MLVPMLGWAFLILTTVQAEPRSSQAVVDRVAACGVGPVTVHYEPELQDDVLTLSPTAPVTDAQLACADRAAPTAFFNWPDAVQVRFEAIRHARGSALALDAARRWLSSRGLLDRVPRYQSGVDERAFARQIEALCGPGAEGALNTQSDVRSINTDWLRREAGRGGQPSEAIICLLHVALVADYSLGFIGNEGQ